MRANSAAPKVPPPVSGTSPPYSAPSASTVSRNDLAMLAPRLSKGRLEFKILVLEHEPDGSLLRFAAHAAKKIQQYLGFGSGCAVVGVTLDQHRRIAHQLAAALFVLP